MQAYKFGRTHIKERNTIQDPVTIGVRCTGETIVLCAIFHGRERNVPKSVGQLKGLLLALCPQIEMHCANIRGTDQKNKVPSSTVPLGPGSRSTSLSSRRQSTAGKYPSHRGRHQDVRGLQDDDLRSGHPMVRQAGLHKAIFGSACRGAKSLCGQKLAAENNTQSPQNPKLSKG